MTTTAEHVHIWIDDPKRTCPKSCKDAVLPSGSHRRATATDETVCGRFNGHDGAHAGWDAAMHRAEWTA